MRLTMERFVKGGRQYVLDISDKDILRARPFDNWDRLLFADIEDDDNATIADYLLGLERFARAIEEGYNLKGGE